jgi:hypothetical protein
MTIGTSEVDEQRIAVGLDHAGHYVKPLGIENVIVFSSSDNSTDNILLAAIPKSATENDNIPPLLSICLYSAAPIAARTL